MNTQSARFCIQQKNMLPVLVYIEIGVATESSLVECFFILLLSMCHLQGMQSLTAVGHNSLQYTIQERPLVPFIPSLKELWPKYFSNVTALTIKHSRNNLGHTRKKNSLLQSHLLGWSIPSHSHPQMLG